MTSRSWRFESSRAPTKPKDKEKKSKTCAKADRRDITLLIIILRHRITPPVPYIVITEIILSISPDTYQDLCQRNCQLENLKEEQQYYWFAWWCKELEKKEIMKGGGRWVAAVNWENERIEEVYGCLRDQLQGRGPVFKLVDEKGVNKLKLLVGQKKELVKQNRILKEKEELMRAKEDQSTLQADWFHNKDWRAGSVPDFTILKPKSVIGQGYPFDDFLRPPNDDLWCWNSGFEKASKISASSTHLSSSSLAAFSTHLSSSSLAASSTHLSSSSLAASYTIPLWDTDADRRAFKTHVAYPATRDSKVDMLNALKKMDEAKAKKEGTFYDNSYWINSNRSSLKMH
ncbi:hypothetical protein NHQ30_002032 [Ciborinia camelliae]|nr:hypothetical protein NHQ30_002032 [Ciborinia camelliae]